MRNRIVIIALLVGFCAVTSLMAAETTYYMGTQPGDFANLQAAMTGMSGGDTLIIRDGTYTGAANVMDYSHRPPNGSSGAYTTFKAENPGKVIFDGQNSRQMLSVRGGGAAGNVSYIQMEGVVACHSPETLLIVSGADHVKLFSCGVYDAGGSGQCCDGFQVAYSSDVLIEDCWSYGAGRKHFYVGKFAQKVVCRRCVVRHDRHYDYADQEAFMVYDARQVELQNCISIDGDQGDFYTGGSPAAKSFTTRNTGDGYTLEDVHVRGCMSIGNDDMMGSSGSNNCEVTYSDFMHWDSIWGNRLRELGANFDHCTVGDISGSSTSSPGVYLEAGDPARNCIVYGVENSYGMWNTDSDYNALYGNNNNYRGTSAGPNDYCSENGNDIDPLDGGAAGGNGTTAMMYLLRIEDDSDLDGAASDGGDIGATIIKRMGKSGSMWGEEGYDLLQDGTAGQADEDLWPFQNEYFLKQQFGSYSYSDAIGTIDGERGFCADGAGLYGGPITLSSYIWEYLGNSVPIAYIGEPGLVGDINYDGFVGGDDLNIVLGAWGQQVQAGYWWLGDIDGDGFVGGDDLNAVLGNWGASWDGSGEPPSSGDDVPEPASATLLLVGAFGMFARRSRRRQKK